MRNIILFLLVFTGICSVMFLSCKKEISCEGCINGNKLPIAVAGSDQVITLPTDSILLDGSSSNDPDGTISEWLWKKIEGPASFTIVNATVVKTVSKSLGAGTYKFELTVTDDKGASAKDTMMVTVDDATATTNHAPIANAGKDTVIILPTSATNLDGRGSTDPDNNISIYIWAKISGPASFNIANANTVQTQLTDLIEGVYQFELKVTDAGGLFDKDTVQVSVIPQSQCPQPSPPLACITNCGRIVFVSDRDGNNEIYTCNADGSNVTRLTNNAAADGDPAWSPDGTRIAFIRSMGPHEWLGNLFIMNADGSNIVQKTFTNDANNPAWSPDGTRIAFTDEIDETINVWIYRIAVMSLTNGAISELLPYTMGSSVEPAPAWSPDGTKIAFNSDWAAWDFVGDIHTICPNGSGLTTLTHQFGNDDDYWNPSWSPDGMKLSVTIFPMYNVSAESSIAVMNADGTGKLVIKKGIVTAEEQLCERRTTWSPDGTRIAYTEGKTIKWVDVNGGASGIIITNGWDADWKH